MQRHLLAVGHFGVFEVWWNGPLECAQKNYPDSHGHLWGSYGPRLVSRHVLRIFNAMPFAHNCSISWNFEVFDMFDPQCGQ
jgi:hypothetical protein